MRSTFARVRSLSISTGLTMLGIAALATPALAGPPLLCHPFDIDTARSLPWDGRTAWFQMAADYDVRKLADDTEALLTPSTPIIVRMETLRRAAIYATKDQIVAKQLWLTINDRVRTSDKHGAAGALALFDAGYLAATLQEVGRLSRYGSKAFGDTTFIASLVRNVDGYGMVQQSLALRNDDAAIEMASALIAASSDNEKMRPLYATHARKARAGAKQDALLAKNLDHISN